MRIAFDVDGVLRDLMTAYMQHVEGREVADLVEYKNAVEFAGGADQFYDLVNQHHCWAAAEPHLHLFAVYRALEKQNHTMLVITENPSAQGRMEMLDWLHRHHVFYDELHFCPNKLMVQFDAIVEDNPDTAFAAACSGRAAFLVARPWTVKHERRHANLFRLPEDAEAAAVIADVLGGREGWKL